MYPDISDVRIVFFHFESNRIVELLFEISNQIEYLSFVSKVTSSKYLLNKFNCFYGAALFKTIVVSVVGVSVLGRPCLLILLVARRGF